MTDIEYGRTNYGCGTHRIRNKGAPKRQWMALDIVITIPLLGAHTRYKNQLQASHAKGAMCVSDCRKLMQCFIKEWWVLTASLL
jgi:hypothetical protein